jgi:membrane-associated protease RseP (regulator of RpoE activity)
MPKLLACFLLLGLPALVWPQEAVQPKNNAAGKTYAVPYRFTESGHIMVRAKINGKGPYNFIVDTGAPLVYIAVPVAKKLGIEAAAKGLTSVGKIQLEGGPEHADFKCVIETPFQLEGMNALGLAGVELHGIMGYALLSHYKMEIDPTANHMKWTRLDFVPPAPQPAGAKDDATTGLDALGTMMKGLAKLLGNKGAPPPAQRAFFGVEFVEKDKGVMVQSVLNAGPAAKAGLKVGDRVVSVDGKAMGTPAEVREVLARVTAGQSVAVVVTRENQQQTINITGGEGL